MPNYTSAFLLKVANALVEEVAQNTDTVLETARRLQERERFMDNLKGAFSAGSLVGQLKNNLELAIRLSDKAAEAGLSNDAENSLTPAFVRGKALFQKGIIAMGQKSFKEAVECFEESLKHISDQAVYFNIAVCFLQMKGIFRDRTQDAITAFENCINLNPNSELAIRAGKELARLGRL